ncbi:MAG: exosortase C-terminal domain/associated protein EpsI [Acidobacteriota bacterium]
MMAISLRQGFSAKTLVLCAALVAAAAAAMVARPTLKEDQSPPALDLTVPKLVGEWRALDSSLIQVGVNETAATDINQPYDQTVMRSYQNPQGHVIQVALAWGRHQRQEVKIHRPELCYPAQGLRVESLHDVTFPLTTPRGDPVVGKRMVAFDRSGQKEVVSYWIRIGHVYSSGAWATRKHILLEGLAGHVTDGILVRVSQRIANDQDEKSAFERQEQFAAQLVNATPDVSKHMLVK